jgi:hypothetical protein
MAKENSIALDPQGASIGYIQWGPIIAGALAAAALALVLHAFAGAIGLAISSASPSWRDASFGLVILSGVYLLIAAVAAYSLGGYVAGRLRTPLPSSGIEEVEFRDGVHGLCVWALATVLTAIVAFTAGSSATQPATSSSGNAGPATSVAGEYLIALDLDRLFRTTEQRPNDYAYARAEAARILLTTSSHDGLRGDDRSNLVRMVASQTGVATEEAEKRVAEATGNARDNIDRSRTVGVILAFIAGASAILGAAAAWFAACAGGKHREVPIPLTLRWRRD